MKKGCDILAAMSSVPVARHRTAIKRTGLSRPIRIALDAGLIGPACSVFDYGCGRGDDMRHLLSLGIPCQGWDPVYHPAGERVRSDVVNLGYVVNVIEDQLEREASLREAWSLAEKVLIVSARLTHESTTRHAEFEDGCLTQRRTFQKYYEQSELRDWIDQVIGISSVAAAPGVFYLFKDHEARESFVAARVRRPVAAPPVRYSQDLFERHRGLLEPLMHFVTERGRLPEEWESGICPAICEEFGGVGRAFAIIRRVTGAEQWEQIREERSQDLLLYLALARFGERPRFSDLPRASQLDIRAFFSSYTKACVLGDDLLFSAGNRELVDEACRTSQIGKLTPEALYVHTTALPRLSPVLRAYDGCARALVGAVEGANIVKLHREKPGISYLRYPGFEKDAHPVLAASLKVDLITCRIKYTEYLDSTNPPILHRKEHFLPLDHPLHSKFSRLTQKEEARGLYDSPHLIGTREGWEKVLTSRGVRISGHRLIRDESSDVDCSA
jgi:DNA phosphorothioation-associated putative methyltransferase